MNDIGETVLEFLEEPNLDHRQIEPDFFIDKPVQIKIEFIFTLKI